MGSPCGAVVIRKLVSKSRLRILPSKFSKRTCKPNSVVCGHSSRRRVAADVHQRPTRRFRQLLEPPGRAGSARHASLTPGPRIPPYLVLLRVGFTLPRTLLHERCALTAPFHPYLSTGTSRPGVSPSGCSGETHILRSGVAKAVYFLWHWPSMSIETHVPGVTWHTTLRSSDFPP